MPSSSLPIQFIKYIYIQTIGRVDDQKMDALKSGGLTLVKGSDMGECSSHLVPCRPSEADECQLISP